MIPPLDHHKFIKYVDVTFTGNIFAFYNILQNFGYKWGVALIPLHDIQYGKSLCPDNVPQGDYTRMTQALYEKLQSADCIPYSFTDIRHTLNRYSSTYDGYQALYDILEDYVPRLKKDADFPAPHAENFNSIHEYADQFNAYLTFEELSDPPRLYSARAKVRKFIDNLGPMYAEAVSKVEDLLATWYDPEPPPPTLELRSLPKTIESYLHRSNKGVIRAAHGGGKQTNYGHQRFSNSANTGIPKGTNTQDLTKVCDACNIPNHYATECHALGKHLLLTKYIRNADEKKLQKAMDNYIANIKPPRIKRSQLKATIRNLVDNNRIDDIMALIPTAEYSDDEDTQPGKLQPYGGHLQDEE